jgi:hypothetical protein
MNYVWEHAVAATFGDVISSEMLVPKTTGDLLCQRLNFAPDVIKIDVEGHEVKVLDGLAATIRDHRPLVFLEVHPSMIQRERNSPEEICDFFEEAGYEAALPDLDLVSPSDLAGITTIYRILYCPKTKEV